MVPYHPQGGLPWLGREKLAESNDPFVRDVGLLGGKYQPLVREPPFFFFVEPRNDSKVSLTQRDRGRLRDKMTYGGLGRARSGIWVVFGDHLGIG
jgi:hypothetical protein